MYSNSTWGLGLLITASKLYAVIYLRLPPPAPDLQGSVALILGLAIGFDDQRHELLYLMVEILGFLLAHAEGLAVGHGQRPDLISECPYSVGANRRQGAVSPSSLACS